MKALIYIELIENISHNYEKEIIEWAKLQHPDLSVFDFDNFSEPAMVQYAIQLLETSDKVVVIIESKIDAGVNNLVGFIEKLIKHKAKTRIILNGENIMLAKMLTLLGDNFKKNLKIELQQKLIEQFFNK